MKMHLNRTHIRNISIGVILTVLIVIIIIAGSKCYEKYTLSQKRLDLSYMSNVYKIKFDYYGRWGGVLTDKKCIEDIMNYLSNVKATNEYSGIEHSVEVKYQVVIKYYDNEGEEEGYSFGVIERNGKHYLVPLLENELWQMDDEFYNYLNETVVKVVSGELE